LTVNEQKPKPLATRFVRLRPEDHEVARRLAYEDHVPMGDIVGAALRVMDRDRARRPKRPPAEPIAASA
jgi:hypothetical protein